MDGAGKNPNYFLKVTAEQFAIPHAGRGRFGDLNRLTPLQWKIVAFVAYYTQFGKRCRLTNLEIGLEIGDDDDHATIIRRIKNAISGRPAHGKRMPGITEKGFFKVVFNTNPREAWQRDIEVTDKWWHPKRVKIADTGPEESAPAATAAVTAAVVAAQTPMPTIEQRSEVFGRRAVAKTRPELADLLITSMRDRGKFLELVDGNIKVRRLNANVEPPSDAEAACLAWLQEEVIAELRPKAAPETAAETTPKAAARVTDPAAIRALIGRLSAAPPGDDTDCEALADSLVAQFKDEQPERSRQTYLGIAQAAARGELPLSIVLEAFEEACKPQKRKRGAAFIHEVKRLKAIHLKANEGKD